MTDQTVKTNTFRLPTHRMGELREALAKLNKKADKLDCPHVSFNVLSTSLVPSPAHIHAYAEAYGVMPDAGEIASFPKVEMNEVELVGAGPKIEGYKFVGTLDHVTLPGQVVVQSVPGEKVPVEFFHIDPVCAHCNKIRNRAETFVLQEDNGNHIQVGRNCLRDFFGHDPSAIVRFLTKVMRLAGDMEDNERGGMRMGDYAYMDKVRSLSTTVAVIRTFGWMSSTAAQNNSTGGPATVSLVRKVMEPAFNRADAEYKASLIREIKWNEEKDLEEANAAIAWLATQPNDPDNSYMHNLHLLSNAEAVPQKMLGYWVSLIAAFQRDQARLMQQKALHRLDEYFGTVGERVDVRVTCVAITPTSGMFGPMTIHRMLTEAGHTLMWFANTDSKMTTGKSYMIRGRIKKHDEYKGYKQTVLSRVTVQSEIQEEVAA